MGLDLRRESARLDQGASKLTDKSDGILNWQMAKWRFTVATVGTRRARSLESLYAKRILARYGLPVPIAYSLPREAGRGTIRTMATVVRTKASLRRPTAECGGV